MGEDRSQQRTPTKGTNPVAALLGIAILAGSVWFYFGGGLEQQAAKSMQDIENKVAADQAAQYDIAKRNGSAMDVCVHAGFVAAAYLQAKDEVNYKRWKEIEKSDCAKAGLER